MTEVEGRIRALLRDHAVVLFMKGTREAPRCGFSGAVVDVLLDHLDDFETVDVLSDDAIREAIKEFSSWPTLPQLYVRGEFVGGADIVRELSDSGELATILGRPVREPEPPDVRLTPAARAALLRFHDGEGPIRLRIKVSADFEYALDFDDASARDLVVRCEGYTLLVDRPSARRLDGTVIDFLERPDGGGFRIDNPNEPPRVRPMTPVELARRVTEGAPFTLFDVRPEAERALASLPFATPLDEKGRALLDELDRETYLVLLCHHGVRSRVAAEHLVKSGFRNVYNLEGGIDAWSRDVDRAIPRY